MTENILVNGNHKWLNEKFVTELIQSDDEPVTDLNRIYIQDLLVEPAVGKGENFLSDLVRVKVKYSKGQNNELKSAFFIVKGQLQKNDENMADDIFQNEIVCFKTILPKVKKLLQSVGDYTELSAECYKVSSETGSIYFVFEDLRQKDYKNIDRKIGLNFNELKLAIIKLAKWHATTAHLAQVEPSLTESFQRGFVNTEVTTFHGYFENVIRNCSEEVATWEGYEKYAEKLSKLVSCLIPRCCSMYKTNPSDFNVINHGDLWMNNIMYHFDSNGIADDTIFVDYSFGFYGSPGIDLNFLFCTSSRETISEVDWDYLMQIYHQELANCLKKLNYTSNIPSLLDIQIEFLKKGFISILFTLTHVPIRLCEDSTNCDLNFMLGTEPQHAEFRRNILRNPRFRPIMEKYLKYFDRKGLLD